MFTRWKLRRQFKKEIDRDALRLQAIAHTKAYFRQRGIPNWTNEYQHTFAAHVQAYMITQTRAYVKLRLKEQQ